MGETLAIPRESIVGDLQNAKVYIVEEGKAVLRSIQVGTVFDKNIQVKKGLQEGETIVVSGQINLEDGMVIAVADKR